jgi:hypothetical protein
MFRGKEEPMERRFELRLEELLEDAVLDPRIPEGMLDRLEQFVEPFAACLTSKAAATYPGVCGRAFSGCEAEEPETIAYLHDQERQALQKFIGQAPWDHGPLLGELTRQVRVELGEADGVLVFDPSAFKKREGIGRRHAMVGV